jgi:N-acyl-D-amino-acid deacylase
MYDTIIKNGNIVDGTGNRRQRADIGIRQNQIESIGDLSNAEADVVLDAREFLVCPGFIDILSHADNYWSLFQYPSAESFLSQGVTSVIGGNCGSSLAPLISPESILSIQKWTDVRNISTQWTTFAELFHFLDQSTLSVNFGSLVGHSTLRRGYVKNASRPLTPTEQESLISILDESMHAGAFGVSTGLGYAHAEIAPPEEIDAFVRTVAERGGLYSTHIRSEGKDLVKAVQEAIDCAHRTGARVEISHLKSKGRENWNNIDEALSLIHRAHDEGIDIAFDLYPYHATLSVLYAYLPAWSYEGGIEALLDNIRGKIPRKKILEEMSHDQHNYGRLRVAKADNLGYAVGKTFAEIAESQESTLFEAVLNTIEGSRGRLLVFDESLAPDTVERLLFDELSLVATDDGFYTTELVRKKNELVHPRAYGAFPKFLELARFTKKLSWEDAIHKITGRVADRLGLKKRGILVPGNAADIVILDPIMIGSGADFKNPFQPASGIHTVLVNGIVAYQDERLMSVAAGRTLRFGAS